MRNTLTNRVRKKTRRTTTRKRHSTFASTPLERLFSEWMLNDVLCFSNCSFVFLWLSIRYFTSSNRALALNVLQRSRLCAYVTDKMIEHESLIVDIQIDEALYHLFSTPAV